MATPPHGNVSSSTFLMSLTAISRSFIRLALQWHLPAEIMGWLATRYWYILGIKPPHSCIGGHFTRQVTILLYHANTWAAGRVEAIIGLFFLRTPPSIILSGKKIIRYHSRDLFRSFGAKSICISGKLTIEHRGPGYNTGAIPPLHILTL